MICIKILQIVSINHEISVTQGLKCRVSIPLFPGVLRSYPGPEIEEMKVFRHRGCFNNVNELIGIKKTFF